LFAFFEGEQDGRVLPSLQKRARALPRKKLSVFLRHFSFDSICRQKAFLPANAMGSFRAFEFAEEGGAVYAEGQSGFSEGAVLF
jgi:hypothetical protein